VLLEDAGRAGARAASRLGAPVKVLAFITPALFTGRPQPSIGPGYQRNRVTDLHVFSYWTPPSGILWGCKNPSHPRDR